MSSVLGMLSSKCHKTSTKDIQEVGGNTRLRFRRKDPKTSASWWKVKSEKKKKNEVIHSLTWSI